MAELPNKGRNESCDNCKFDPTIDKMACSRVNGWSCHYEPKSSPVLGETVMPLVKDCYDDYAGYSVAKKHQRDADLAILRAERLKEGEWLEKWARNYNEDNHWENLNAHIASLKGDRGGG